MVNTLVLLCSSLGSLNAKFLGSIITICKINNHNSYTHPTEYSAAYQFKSSSLGSDRPKNNNFSVIVSAFIIFDLTLLSEK